MEKSSLEQIGLLSLFKTQVLGKGCNGTVFRGHFLSTIDVAIKRVEKYFFRVESNLLLKAALHPNIIRYYATEDDNFEFLLVNFTTVKSISHFTITKLFLFFRYIQICSH